MEVITDQWGKWFRNTKSLAAIVCSNVNDRKTWDQSHIFWFESARLSAEPQSVPKAISLRGLPLALGRVLKVHSFRYATRVLYFVFDQPTSVREGSALKTVQQSLLHWKEIDLASGTY